MNRPTQAPTDPPPDQLMDRPPDQLPDPMPDPMPDQLDAAMDAHLDADAWTVRLPTVADTERLGALLARRLDAGDLVVLSGPLGAGKTALARGIGAGLGVSGPVTSPTFVIARVHHGPRVPLVHVDAYRLGSIDEVDALDLDTDLADAVVVVEWGEGLVERLADEHLLIGIERLDDETRVASGRWLERAR